MTLKSSQKRVMVFVTFLKKPSQERHKPSHGQTCLDFQGVYQGNQRKGGKEKIQTTAKEAGLSATAFIVAAVTEKMNRGFVPPRWEPEPYQEHMESGVPAPYCGVCGRVLLDEHNDQFRFCPDCGTPVRWDSDEAVSE